MPLTDQARIAADRTAPRIMRLWFALQPLKSTVSLMNTGAHPDDETTGMLAALGLREGYALSFACANRGEGGQNDIGTEVTEDLGTLRTAEMERAADVLGMNLYWLSETPEDSIFDFGFSKSGKETLAKWGYDRTLARFVDIVRDEKPDIICPTFLDVPGQHGHHRAMTELAHRVIQAAPDPAFAGSALPPWQVKKLYLPAWSGAGQSYDDDLPPPPATVVIPAEPGDPISGWSWDRIGQQSRAFHQTQGMGRWVAAGETRDWPLHLAESLVEGDDTSLESNLPATVGQLAKFAGASQIDADLQQAQTAIDLALSSFPDFGAVAEAAADALRSVRAARAACPEHAIGEVDHRLDRKERQLSAVIRIAAGVEVSGRLNHDWLTPGEATALSVEQDMGTADEMAVDLDLPEGWSVEDGALTASSAASPSDPYPPIYRPLDPPSPAMRVRIQTAGVESETRLPLETTPVLLPDRAAELSPETVLLNLETNRRVFDVSVSDQRPGTAEASLVLPETWSAERSDGKFTVRAPGELAEGLYTLPLHLDGQPASTVRRFSYPHTAPRARAFPATVRVRAISAKLPQVKVGYVGGGSDSVDKRLAALGVDVRDVTEADLQNPRALEAFDTIIVGIFALRFHPTLLQAMPALHRWAEAGGTLVTLYHRPWDNWDPDTVPPRRLEIGQPSLRWRVTDETAEVTHLVPDHPLLNTPNGIGPADWFGWHKERGLYFAKSWDEAYVPLLEMADPDEQPHRGILLAADIGRGRHIHTSLILHHQMEKLVPGAFRIMANLIAKR